MRFIQRLGYYGAGFAIGVLLLFFFLGGKKTSCDYGPNARTLKNIRLKERVYSEMSLKTLQDNKLDTSDISSLLWSGDVIFSESNTRLDSCKQYVIKGEVSEKRNLRIRVENCEDVATVMTAEVVD